jgi:hypothetical protein
VARPLAIPRELVDAAVAAAREQDGPASRIAAARFPSMFRRAAALLMPQVRAGQMRDLPLPLLIQLMAGPLAMHMLLRPTLQAVPGVELPTVDETCEIFADAFLRAVGKQQTGGGTTMTKES